MARCTLTDLGAGMNRSALAPPSRFEEEKNENILGGNAPALQVNRTAVPGTISWCVLT